jgi:hypothetical protein
MTATNVNCEPCGRCKVTRLAEHGDVKLRFGQGPESRLHRTRALRATRAQSGFGETRPICRVLKSRNTSSQLRNTDSVAVLSD